MTFKQMAIKMMTDGCLDDTEAQQIFETVKADSANRAMEGRWEHEVEGYPPEAQAVLRIAVNNAARAYIDQNCPQAWFRPFFA